MITACRRTSWGKIAAHRADFKRYSSHRAPVGAWQPWCPVAKPPERRPRAPPGRRRLPPRHLNPRWTQQSTRPVRRYRPRLSATARRTGSAETPVASQAGYTMYSWVVLLSIAGQVVPTGPDSSASPRRATEWSVTQCRGKERTRRRRASAAGETLRTESRPIAVPARSGGLSR